MESASIIFEQKGIQGNGEKLAEMQLHTLSKEKSPKKVHKYTEFQGELFKESSRNY